MTKPIRAKISALGTYVPPRLLTNADLEKMVDTNNEWIMARVGIRERHIAEKGVATSDLAVEAAKKALAQRGLAPTDIDVIIVGTVTPDMFFPSTACLVQDKLGREGSVGIRPFRSLLGIFVLGAGGGAVHKLADRTSEFW